ncbi:DUF3309 family protein [Dyella humi]|uniref:DUF3309 family protein n=1 Tax=Dyella humi TaxID=1770547 RepID=UPI00360E45AC
MSLIVLIALLIVPLGALPTWLYNRTLGYYPLGDGRGTRDRYRVVVAWQYLNSNGCAPCSHFCSRERSKKN